MLMENKCASDCRNPDAAAKDLAASIRAGRRIEYVSIAWTSVEALAGVMAGFMADSIPSRWKTPGQTESRRIKVKPQDRFVTALRKTSKPGSPVFQNVFDLTEIRKTP